MAAQDKPLRTAILLLLLLLHLPVFLLSLAGGPAGASPHRQRLQTLVLSADHPPAQREALLPGGEAPWLSRVTHRAAMASPAGMEEGALSERLRRDAARVEAINARVDAARQRRGPVGSGRGPAMASARGSSGEGLVSPTVSGLSQGSGEYFTRLGVGTPPRELYLVLDTGSDLSWIQCSPCASCYPQADPVFSPSLSSSFARVPCAHRLCSELQPPRSCHGGACAYRVWYGDGSFTAGELATEAVTFPGGRMVAGAALGCGHDNEGLFVGAAGVLGLGAGALSFPSQLSASGGGGGSGFAYCLADRERGGAGWLLLGGGAAVAEGATSAPLLRNPSLPTFYYVALTGISVGGVTLAIREAEFAISASGDGGAIIDSGTSVTRLAVPAYVKLRDAFVAGAHGLPRAPPFSLFDTCFDLGGMESVDVPSVALRFEGGASMELPAANYLVAIDAAGTYCLAFSPAPGNVSIVGNLQQQGFGISFDVLSSRIGFASGEC